MKKKIDWARVLEIVILILILLLMIWGGVTYIKSISTFQAIVTILVFLMGSVVGTILTKWYVKYVKKLPWKTPTPEAEQPGSDR